MGGFKNKNLNNFVKQSIFNDMIKFIFISLESMKHTNMIKKTKIPNEEEKIRNHLVENYLNKDEFKRSIGYDNLELRFWIEAQENYDIENEKYRGRTDIRVISPDYFRNIKNYYTIECKRIDGSLPLNRLFVTEGICRFVLKEPKYLSHNKKNIMLGFIIKNINIEQNVSEIDEIQRRNKDIRLIGELRRNNIEKSEYYLYKSEYECDKKHIELNHMFYDLSSIIEK